MPRLDVDLVRYEQVTCGAEPDRILGVAAYGSSPRPSIFLEDVPVVAVDMPALETAGFFEIWRSSERVKRVTAGDVRCARDSRYLFGAIEVPSAEPLQRASREVYEQIFDALDALGFPFLLRAWNYFPRINVEEEGLERYRQFNVGRYDAFVSRRRTDMSHLPAACALGSRDGSLTVYFIAGKHAGTTIENPRQVNAFDYPAQYGPRSPTFSRAMLASDRCHSVLFISGTASIVGHRTLHPGDCEAQIAETLENIGALVRRAAAITSDIGAPAARFLKVYLRDPAHLPIVRAALSDAFDGASVGYLTADICRSDLLVEVEAVHRSC